MEEQISIGGRERRPMVWVKLVAILAITAIVIVALVRDRIVVSPQWTVNVTGQGKVLYKPDIAIVTVGVQVDRAKTAEAALPLLNEAMNKIIPALKDAGIPEADIQTQNYSLSPQYDSVPMPYYPQPATDDAMSLESPPSIREMPLPSKPYDVYTSTVTGYTANQQLVIKVKNFGEKPELVSTVIELASKNGANQIQGVSFDASNINDLKQQARILAIEDARSKAGGLGQAAHVRLGKIVGWWENFVQAPGNPGMYYADRGSMGGGGVSPQVPSGSQEIIVEVGVTYRIK